MPRSLGYTEVMDMEIYYCQSMVVSRLTVQMSWKLPSYLRLGVVYGRTRCTTPRLSMAICKCYPVTRPAGLPSCPDHVRFD